MAEPIIQQIILDLRRAEQQLDALGRQIANLDDTIVVPVQVEDSQLDQLQADLAGADETIDVSVSTPGAAQAEQVFQELNVEIDRTEDELEQARRRADDLGDELKRTGDTGTGAFGSLRSAILPLVATFAAGFGIRELVGQFREAVTSATNLGESINAVNVVFGEGARDVLAFGENAAQSVGLATSEFNQLAVPIGALLNNLGLDSREAAAATTELTTRAADLASVFNTDVTDALQAVGSALRGEQEPIRRYGVNLNQAAIDAKALELGLAGVGGEVSQAARGQATDALLLEQTAFAAGDFANTSDDAANRQRILNAEIENARASLGEALLPAFESLLGVMPEVIGAIEEAAPALAEMAEGFVNVAVRAAEAIGPIARFFTDTARETGFLDEDVFASFTEGLEGVNVAIANIDRGLGLELSGVADAFGASGSEAVRAAEDFREFLDLSQDLADAIRAGADPIEAFGEAFDELNENVPITAEALDSLIRTSTLGGDSLRQVLRGIVENAEGLGLTADEIRAVRDAFNELFDTGLRGEGLNFGRVGGLNEATSALDEFRESLGQVFDQSVADTLLEDAFGDLPTVISDLGTLQQAAEDAGGSLQDFVTDVPEDVVINVDPALISIGTLIERLEEVQALLAEPTAGPEAEIEVPVNAKGEVDVDAFLANVIEAIEAEADVEVDLGEVFLQGGPDAAAFLEGFDEEVAASLARAFALNPEASAELQAALDGSLEGLAQPAADRLAEALETATPQAIADLGVFAAQNFISDKIRGQILESAGEVANQLEIALGQETIQPEIIIDLSKAQITGLNVGGQIDIGGGFGDTPGTGTAPPPPRGDPGITQDRVTVNINNPEVRDLDTSAAQAAQTIAAVSGSLERAN